MRITDVVEWTDDYGQELVHRVPQYGSGDFRLGSQLIVRENQQAVFMRDGRALDVFGPGRHTLETVNLPLLAELLKIPFGGKTPFTAEVYFINTRVFQDMKWGTPQPIVFRDPELKMVRLRAFGSYSMRVADPQVFVAEISGTVSSYDRETLNTWMRDFIISRMIDMLGELKRSILDLPMYYEELAVAIKSRVVADFGKYGIDLVDFNIGAITPPEEVQKMIDQRTGMSVIGDMGTYMQFQTAQAIPEAAKQPGGLAGAGLGLGAGVAMGQAIAGAMGGAQAQQATPVVAAAAPAGEGVVCPSCDHQNPPGAKFCMDCGAKFEQADVFCPECGHKNPAGAKFCMDCGAKFAA